MSSTSKRARGTNFTKEEQLILVEEVRKYKKIIENKATNKISCNEKLEAWRNIALAFNSQVFMSRTSQQLQAKYENLKTELRKVMTAQRLAMTGTGGGPFVDVKDDPILSVLLELVNSKTVVGLYSKYDGDASLPVDSYNEANCQVEQDKVLEPVNELFLPPANPQVLSCEVLSEDVFMDLQCSTQKVIPQISLKEKIQTAGSSRDDSIGVTNRKLEEVTSALQADIILESNDWSDYTPRKLKRPMNGKLRPTVPNPVSQAKAQYYNAKAKLMARELEILNLTENRNAEEHKKKMELLDLEIDKKKRETNT